MKKIIVIEDEEDIRLHLLKILTLEGFEALGAENGESGVQLVKDQLPDVVICDIMMPGLNGYGVLAEIRKHPPTASIPFIFLTAKAEAKDFRQGMTLGADDYLTKPFTLDELLTVIRMRLEKHEKILTGVARQQEPENPFLLSPYLPSELRSPLKMLQDVSATLSSLDKMPEPEEVAAMARVMREQSIQLEQLVENALLYADLELLKSEPHSASAWLRNDFIETESFITFFAGHEAVQAQRERDLKLELVEAGLRISSRSFQKIIRELLKAAFRISEAGTPVKLKTTMIRGEFCLTVVNSATGLSRKELSEMMNALQASVTRPKGSGLNSQSGLAIASTLAQLCHGKLTVDSVPKQETTLTVSLKEVR